MEFDFELSIDLDNLNIKPFNPSMTEVRPFRMNVKEDEVRRRRDIIARSSMVSDIDKCRQMAYYNWIETTLDDEESGKFFMATALGTGGHKLIEVIHLENNYDIPFEREEKIVREAAYEALEENKMNLARQINLDNLEDNMQQGIMDTLNLVQDYKKLPKNKDVWVSNIEQSFVMPIQVTYHGETYILYITGTIDQIATYRKTGQTAIRDLKFRDSQFRPSWIELKMHKQLLLYTAAARYGVPTCDECKPRYESDYYTGNRTVDFNGLCDECSSKIGTELWPGKLPDLRELIWMKDLETYKRNYKGKKKGETKGQCIYTEKNEPNFIDNMLKEIVETIVLFQNGNYQRNPGDHCLQWCSRSKDCLSSLNDHTVTFDIE